jgi:hypothetical protein
MAYDTGLGGGETAGLLPYFQVVLDAPAQIYLGLIQIVRALRVFK